MKNKSLWILAAGLVLASLTHAEPEKKAAPRGGFKAVDTNADGFVSQAELVAFRVENAKKMAAEKGEAMDEKRANGLKKRLEKAFAEADANHDGKLDREEFAAMPKGGPGEGKKKADS